MRPIDNIPFDVAIFNLSEDSIIVTGSLLYWSFSTCTSSIRNMMPLYSIYAARQENPNAYDPWTEDDDKLLKEMWSEGKSVADIAEHFRRKESAIIVRIKKLKL